MKRGPKTLHRPPGARLPWVRVGVVVGPVVLALAIPLACATKSAPVGPGEECFSASDCQPGLVCIAQRGGARVCTSDLTTVAGRPPPEGGADVAVNEAGDAPDDGPAPPIDSGQDTGTVDTGITDTGTGG